MRRGGATIRQRCGEVLLLLACASAAWAAITVITGGFVLRAGPLALASRGPFRPLVLSLALALVARLLLGSEPFGAWAWFLAGSRAQWPARVALAAAGVVLVGALAWNTWAAGGSDSSCYVLQADALASAHATLPPVLPELPPGAAPAAFAPTGFVPSPGSPRYAVPICAAGLAVMMTPATVASRDGVFLVVPVFAALAVWLTFALGRAFGDELAGACAAVLLACSPIFLYQAVQPMSDVPAAALWLAALVGLGRRTARGAIAGGLCASMAVLARPNMLVAVIPLFVLFTKREAHEEAQRPRKRDRLLLRLVCFAAAAAPAAAAMLLLNAARYGAPFASGYGRTDVLFSIAHVAPNLARYPRWLLETETPFIALALAAPWALWRGGRGRLALASSAAVIFTFATYLAYTVFDDWWYIRFLLPVVPVLILFSVIVVLHAAARVSPSGGASRRRVVAALLCVALGGWLLHEARARSVFELQALESRFVLTGAYVRRALPSNAVVLAVQESGSVRYHGGRPTLAWDAVAPGALDESIAWLRERGYAPFLALEDAEEPRFRARFGTQAAGGLDWPPRAEIHAPVRVRVYDPADRARYLGGSRLETEHVWRR